MEISFRRNGATFKYFTAYGESVSHDSIQSTGAFSAPLDVYLTTSHFSGCNAWLNGVIAYHVRDMLVHSHQSKRYFPPSLKKVTLECCFIYLWMAFLASWPLIDAIPISPRLSAGVACLPHEYDKTSTIFMWTLYMPLFVLIPTGYVLFVAIDVVRRRMLPPSGKERDLAVYFARLVIVFLVMWIPSLCFMFVAGGHLDSLVSLTITYDFTRSQTCWTNIILISTD